MSAKLGLQEKDNKVYVSVLSSDGTLRRVVPEGTPNSVTREYETSDGKSGVKHELIYKELSGWITNLEMFDGEFGMNLVIEMAVSEDKEEKLYLSLGTGSAFGEDFMKKLPNIKLDEIVTIAPYSFEDDKNKMRKGLTITQNATKITNYFYDAEAEKTVHGFPSPKGDTAKYSKDKWKAYFLDARIFLTDYTKENFVEKVFGNTVAAKDNF